MLGTVYIKQVLKYVQIHRFRSFRNLTVATYFLEQVANLLNVNSASYPQQDVK